MPINHPLYAIDLQLLNQKLNPLRKLRNFSLPLFNYFLFHCLSPTQSALWLNIHCKLDSFLILGNYV